MKKVLMVATIASTIGQFNMGNIRLLQELGYEVHIACDFIDISIWPEERIKSFKEELTALNVKCFQICFTRNALNIKKHWSSYKQFKGLLQQEKYSFIHTHTPVASAIARIAAKMEGIKVIYTAHGFHFFKGAPFKNWLIFYPIESWLSKYTDVLITINQEDYKRAKRCFRAKRTVYIPGVGIDTRMFSTGRLTEEDKQDKREEVGLPRESIVLISVGELNANKNQELAIKGIAKLKMNYNEIYDKVQYIICGQGKLKLYLEKLIVSLGVEEHVHLLGYQTRIQEILEVSDVFIFLSKREGLPVSLMEAMAMGLPSVCSAVRGNIDLIRDKREGYIINHFEVDEVVNAIYKLIIRPDLRRKMGKQAQKRIEDFSIAQVSQIMRKIYEGINESRI